MRGFKGEIKRRKGSRTTRYNLHYCILPDRVDWSDPMCHTDTMGRHLIDYGDPISTWGYHAYSTYQTAVCILFYTPRLGGQIPPGLAGKWDRLLHDHHVRFGDEVLASLPDNWEMPVEDIFKWLLEQEAKTKGTS